MKIIKTTLPVTSLLNKTGIRYDYADGYMASVSDSEDKITPIDVVRAFFVSAPEWVNNLLTLRDRIVSVFGLKTSSDTITDRQRLINNFKCEAGEQVGLFKVFTRTDKEVILGEDDKHLDFRISIFLDDLVEINARKNLTISTTVIFHNWLGRLYFMFVKPFHTLIVPTMLRGIVKELEKINTFKN